MLGIGDVGDDAAAVFYAVARSAIGMVERCRFDHGAGDKVREFVADMEVLYSISARRACKGTGIIGVVI